MVKKQLKLNPYFLLIVSFLGITLLGSFLLSMPFAFRDNPNNQWCHVGNYMDAFFTALGAMSLTGVTTYPGGLVNTLSTAGQIIILVLMQIGGLGIVTILTFLFTIFRRRLQFKDRLFISQAISFNNYSEIIKFVWRMIIITAICETIGTALGIPLFLHIFPGNFPKALYYSVFHAVNALLIKDGHKVQTHQGTHIVFSMRYIKNGTFPAEDGRLYSQLQTMREESDYNCIYDVDPEELKSKLPPAKNLIDRIDAIVTDWLRQ